MRILFVVLSFLFMHHMCSSQTILKATSQGWVGGVCCVSGTNYSVVFELPTSVRSIEVDSVYLQTFGWVPSTLHPEYKVENTRRVNLNFEIRRDKHSPYMFNEVLDHPITRNFEGAALIVLKVNGKRIEKTISSFEELGFLAYP